MRKIISLILLVCMLTGMTFPLTTFAADEAEIILPYDGEWIDPAGVMTIMMPEPSDDVSYVISVVNVETHEFVIKNHRIDGDAYAINRGILEYGQRYKIWVGTYEGSNLLGQGDTVYINTIVEDDALTNEEMSGETSAEESEEKTSELDGIFTGISEWAAEEMEKAYKAKLIPDELLYKDLTEDITRAEFAALAVRLYEKVTNEEIVYGECPFSDVHWSDIAVKKAYSIGIIKGVTDTLFMPDQRISREQLAAMLLRVFKRYLWSGWSIETDGEYPVEYSLNELYVDHSDISEYAIPAVYFLKQGGIVSGIDYMHFAPKDMNNGLGVATREQAILMASRCYNVIFKPAFLVSGGYLEKSDRNFSWYQK